MVLVMLSSTLGLNIGFDASIRRLYQRDMEITVQAEDSVLTPEELLGTAQRVFARRNLSIKNSALYDYYELTVNAKDGKGRMTVTALTAQEYGRCTGTVPLLKENEALFTLCGTDNDDAQTLDIGGVSLVRTGGFEAPLPHGAAAAAANAGFDGEGECALVVKDESVLEDMCRASDGEEKSGVLPGKICYFGFDTDGVDAVQIQARAELQAEIRKNGNLGYDVVAAADSRGDFRTVYGGLFFLGIFLGVLFIMATALIIYYKQLSESMENRQEYGILLRVGMSAGELRGAVKSQVYVTFLGLCLQHGIPYAEPAGAERPRAAALVHGGSRGRLCPFVCGAVSYVCAACP